MTDAPLEPLPPKPEPPKDYDCCGGGCADCELRLYIKRLAEWKKLEAVHLERSEKRHERR